MARRTKLSEVFHLAADEHLWDGGRDPYNTEYSCLAIENAVLKGLGGSDKLAEQAIHFAERCGLPDQAEKQIERAFRSTRNRQDFRYAWLKFLALYAEELDV